MLFIQILISNPYSDRNWYRTDGLLRTSELTVFPVNPVNSRSEKTLEALEIPGNKKNLLNK